jgi:leucyl/phenylalanyl-tRNA--protein transferase
MSLRRTGTPGTAAAGENGLVSGRAAVPQEPSATEWQFPDPARWPDDDLVGVGADLQPGTMLAAYRTGLFPMPLTFRRRSVLAWWSPDPRGVLPLHRLRVSRSLRASARRLDVRVDTAFPAVLAACADPRRPHGWISPDIRSAYLELHRLGWAHSVEAWTRDDRLVGGLYGVSIGGLFAGESMWHADEPAGRDASKVALVALVEHLRGAGDAERRLLDVQWQTPHLASLGATAIPRSLYLSRVAEAVELPTPTWPGV